MQALLSIALLLVVAARAATTLQGRVDNPDLSWSTAAPICWNKPTDRCYVNVTVENESGSYWQKLSVFTNATFASLSKKTSCADLVAKAYWSVDMPPSGYTGYELILPAMAANESISEAYIVVSNCNKTGVYYSYIFELGTHCDNACEHVWGPQVSYIPSKSNKGIVVAIVLLAIFIPVIFGGLAALFYFYIRPRMLRNEYQSVRDAPSPATGRR